MHLPSLVIESYFDHHAHDAVHWERFREAAWERAREEGKPVLLSFGYKGSLGCEKMHRECFELPFIADLMNRHFVCVLIDREEHPILDSTALEVSHMVAHASGWPIQVFCLPDGRPFTAGNDFPPQDMGDGRIPWPQLLMRIYNHFKKEPESLVENANGIVRNLQYFNQPPVAESIDRAVVAQGHRQAIELLLQHSDPVNGGWRGEVKFPCPMLLEVMDQVIDRYPDLAEALNRLLDKTFEAIATGGLLDASEGGFWRYTRKQWEDPYLEKSAAENALLVRAYATRYRRTKNPLYADIIHKTSDWLEAAFEGKSYHTPIADLGMFRSQAIWATTLLGLDFLPELAERGAHKLQNLIERGLSLESDKTFTLTDMAVLLEGALKLYDRSPSASAEENVQRLFEKIVLDFQDTENIGFFESIVGIEDWCLRRKVWMDSTLPAGQTLLFQCLAHPLLRLVGKTYFEDLQKVYLQMWQKIPQAASYTLLIEID